MSTIDDGAHHANPDVLSHLTQLLIDMSQDRQDMLSYICKLESNQELLLSELKLLRKQYACLVHEDNLLHLASALEGRHDLPSLQPAELVHHGGGGQVVVVAENSSEPAVAEFGFGGEQSDELIPVPDKNTLNITIKKNKITPTVNHFKKDSAYISKMTKTLVRLERKYAIPVDKRKPAMFTRKPRTKHIIPKEFSAIYHLLAAPESKPVTVPDPYPTVDWSTVRFRPALPDPDLCPVYSVSKDPSVYLEKPSSWNSGQTYSTFNDKHPFGTIPGYYTQHGIVSVPSTPVQGYVYCPENRKWMIFATSPTTSGGRRTPPGGTPGTRGREEGRRGKQPRNHR